MKLIMWYHILYFHNVISYCDIVYINIWYHKWLIMWYNIWYVDIVISYCDIIVRCVYIVCYIIYFLQCTYELYHTILCQVKAKEQEIKHKLRPINAFLKAKDMNLPAELLELLKSNLPISPVAPSARDAAMPLNRGIATYMHKICTKYLAARFLDRVELVELERVELVERGRSRRHRGGRSWRVRLYDTYDIIHSDPWYHTHDIA